MTSETTADKQGTPPKVFISYSWTSDEHAEWVLNLAGRLQSDGIETILDRWHLKSGQDKYKFMEQMVTDPTVTKVLMVCDRRYAEKADGREGGVGDETQIVSPEIYGKTDQTKFLPLVADPTRDEKGQPYKPQYLKARIHIDLSDPLTFEQGFEELLRDIVGKPVHIPPPLGKLPFFLLDDSQKPLPTAHKLSTFRNALLATKPTATGLADDYLNQLLQEMEQFHLQKCGDASVSLEENIRKCLDTFLPYRDEYIEFLLLITQYGSDPRLFAVLPRFFTKALRFIVRYLSYDADRGAYEPYRFLIPELFLYTIAALLKQEHYEAVNDMLARRYYDSETTPINSQAVPVNYEIFCPYLQTLENLQRNPGFYDIPSPTARLLFERASRDDIRSLDVLNADYVLYARHLLCPDPCSLFSWGATLRPYANNTWIPFFINAQSRSVFARAKVVLNVQDKEDLNRKFAAAAERVRNNYEDNLLTRDQNRMQIDLLDTV